MKQRQMALPGEPAVDQAIMSLPQGRIRDDIKNHCHKLYYSILLHTITLQIVVQNMLLQSETYARNQCSRQLKKYLTSSNRSNLETPAVANLFKNLPAILNAVSLLLCLLASISYEINPLHTHPSYLFNNYFDTVSYLTLGIVPSSFFRYFVVLRLASGSPLSCFYLLYQPINLNVIFFRNP